jgi:hypothetical protein
MKSTEIIADPADTPETESSAPGPDRNPRADYCALFKIYAAKTIPVTEDVE